MRLFHKKLEEAIDQGLISARNSMVLKDYSHEVQLRFIKEACKYLPRDLRGLIHIYLMHKED